MNRGGVSGVEIRMVREAMGGVSVACNVAPLACKRGIYIIICLLSISIHASDGSVRWTALDRDGLCIHPS